MHIRRLLAPPTAAGVVVLALAAPAGAHVTITPDTTAAGAYAVLTVSVPHGCEGSPTRKVAIQIPEEILSVTPTRNALWQVTKEQERLAEPVTDAHGNEVTERDAVVVYTTRKPLPEGYRDAFELSVQLPDAEGETLAFPAIQTCTRGETAWTEIAAEGQDPHALERPAPTVTITAAEGEGHEEATEAETEPSTGSEGSGTLGAVGLGAGLLGLLAGGAALVQVRRRG